MNDERRRKICAAVLENAGLIKAYAALRKHETACKLCSVGGYEHLCSVRRPLWEQVTAVKVQAGKSP